MYSAIIFLVFATSSTWSKVITDEKPSCSSITEFACGDGSCVRLERYCDGALDCGDGSDEATCDVAQSQHRVLRSTIKQVLQDQCRDNEWTCNDGTCINNLRKCNGVMDCPDGTDETALLCDVNICTESQFRCSYGACVSRDAPCDGVPDCADNSDELLSQCSNQTRSRRHEEQVSFRYKRQATCGKVQWKCRDGTCISTYGKCDGVKDCPDGSDETFALCRKTPCQSNWFRCTYGACVDGTAPCNNVQDCVDNSDELLRRCRNQTEEVRGTFKCDNGQEIPAFSHCDGAKDCTDGSDETVKACAGKTCASYLFQCAYGACVDQGSNCDDKQDCADGSDESDELCNRQGPITSVTVPSVPQSGGPCVLPPYPPNGHYRVSNVPGAVPGQSFFSVGLNISCYSGYGLTGSVERLCVAGVWQPTVVTNNECTRFCRLNKDPSVRFRCLLFGNSEGSRECNEYEPEGTLVAPACNAPNYYHKGFLPYMRCINGQWDYVARCYAGLVKNGTNITILIKDQIEVYISGIKYTVNATGLHKNVTGINVDTTKAPAATDFDYAIDEEDWRMGPTKRTRYPITSTRPPILTTPISTTNPVKNREDSTPSSQTVLYITNSTVLLNSDDKIYFREDP